MKGRDARAVSLTLAVLLSMPLAPWVVPRACAAPSAHWVGTWGAAPDSAGPVLSDQSVREIVRISIGGSKVRLRLSNLFGLEAVEIGPVHIAQHMKGSSIRHGTDRSVSFAGHARVSIPAGASVLSDATDLEVAPLAELAVSLFVPPTASPATQHSLGMQTAYLTEHGDATAAERFPDEDVISARPFLTDVEVLAAPAAWSIVTFGDSITDAAASTPDMNRRWPDRLAERLQADPKLATVGVINEGITGNRILKDKMGPSALNRLERDAIEKAGVRWMILLEGVNDFGYVGAHPAPGEDVSAAALIDGMRTLVRNAHAHGIKIIGGTLTPFGQFDWPYHTLAAEMKRQAVNRWIRTGGEFDAVADFDAAVRDPAHPDRLRADYDGDHIHPNDAGCAALARAVELTALARSP